MIATHMVPSDSAVHQHPLHETSPVNTQISTLAPSVMPAHLVCWHRPGLAHDAAADLPAQTSASNRSCSGLARPVSGLAA